MSIVERVLGKLQQQGGRSVTGPRATPVPTVVPGQELHGQGAKVAIDVERLRALGALPPEKHAARVAEEYQRIKRPLLANAFDRAAAEGQYANLIVITSALPGDGKTFTALNLALAMAAGRGQTVLLVDGDVRRASLSQALGIRELPGLLDVLSNESSALTDVIIDTDFNALKLLSSGTQDPEARELMASERLAQVFHEFAAAYPHCVVVFDSSPLLATNEAQILAALVGQVVLVVKADETPAPAVEEALRMLDQTKSLNVVLNQAVALLGQERHYGSYY